MDLDPDPGGPIRPQHVDLDPVDPEPDPQHCFQWKSVQFEMLAAEKAMLGHEIWFVI